MKIIMDTTNINSIKDMANFMQANEKSQIFIESKKDKYNHINKILVGFRYQKERKKNKTIIKKYLKKITGYSVKQIKRLIKKQKDGKLLCSLKRTINNRNGFKRKYGSNDIALLIKTDIVHKTLNGRATKEILKREYEIFQKEKYENISKISVSHIYNIRNKSRQYLSSENVKYSKTNPTSVNIGERKKPDNQGKLGYIRVDTVHQGDKNKEKGVYHINMVDEILQWEIVGCVEKISEYYLLPLLTDLLDQFPFKIINFHSDNGSEYINKIVANLLNKLLIEQTKSRTRHCNDNALVEGKNGAIIRKHIGRLYISQKHARSINNFYKNYLNIYLNFHRPSGFAIIRTDRKGKEKKVYNLYCTPYEALKSHPRASIFLKKNISFKELDKIAYQQSDNEFAELMKKEKEKLFISFKN